MFEIKLKNNKSFPCDESTLILDAAKNSGVILEHSCLSARCRSCMVKVLEGKVENLLEEFVLSEEEKKEGYILSCNAKPVSDLKLDIEDLGVKLNEVRILPCKIHSKKKLSADIIRVILRMPPKANFKFIPGQYVNVIKGAFKRSYSIANSSANDSKIELLIKRYESGLMSNYWFQDAKKNDLLRLEGPLGTFFYRTSEAEDIVFLATGTGIAPIKAILQQISENKNNFRKKKILVIWGGRFFSDLFWKPHLVMDNFKFIPVLSRPDENWDGLTGYVQNVLLEQLESLKNAQVYACGSNEMILSSRILLENNGLPKNNFYSDAFVKSN